MDQQNKSQPFTCGYKYSQLIPGQKQRLKCNKDVAWVAKQKRSGSMAFSRGQTLKWDLTFTGTHRTNINQSIPITGTFYNGRPQNEVFRKHSFTEKVCVFSLTGIVFTFTRMAANKYKYGKQSFALQKNTVFPHVHVFVLLYHL